MMPLEGYRQNIMSTGILAETVWDTGFIVTIPKYSNDQIVKFICIVVIVNFVNTLQ